MDNLKKIQSMTNYGNIFFFLADVKGIKRETIRRDFDLSESNLRHKLELGKKELIQFLLPDINKQQIFFMCCNMLEEYRNSFDDEITLRQFNLTIKNQFSTIDWIKKELNKYNTESLNSLDSKNDVQDMKILITKLNETSFEILKPYIISLMFEEVITNNTRDINKIKKALKG
jgi:hypothetical protein